MSISELRNKMKQMMSAVEEEQKSTSSSSDRYWNITVDSAGNGSATIRFLPSKDLTKAPYATVYSHWFTHPVTGKTYNELSGSTFKESDDILGQFNSWLWKKGEEEKARGQKRKVSHYVNILVVKDPANPENDGKVFVYRMGSKILDKIKAQLSPVDDDDTPVNVFDLFEGKNFRLKAKLLAGYRNYDDSSFAEKITPVADTDAGIEDVYSKVFDVHDLYIDKAEKKSNDAKLDVMRQVFGRDPLFLEWCNVSGHILEDAPKTKKVVEDDDDDVPAPKAQKATAPVKQPAPTQDSDIDDILADLGL